MSIQYPFNDSPSGSLLKTHYNSLDDLRSSLYFFLTTKKGERWYYPDFGTRLYEYLFEPNDSITGSEVVSTLRAELELYFRQVLIQDISIDQTQSNTILINVDFIFNGTASTVGVEVPV